jgi:hypothetical protein
MENDNVIEVIDILEEAGQNIAKILKDNQTLSLRVSSTLERLANGMKVLIGKEPSENKKVFEMEKLKTILGREIHEKKELKVVTPNKTDVDLLRETANTLYDTFREQESKELIERLTDMELRAVAKKAGLEVTSTQPAKMTVQFVDKIKESILKQKELKVKQELELSKDKK